MDQHTTLDQKMSSNKLRKLRPVTRLSPGDEAMQSLFAEDMFRWMAQPPPERLPKVIDKSRIRLSARAKIAVSSRPQTVKLPPLLGLSHAGGLGPHPPLQKRKTEVDCRVKIQPDKPQPRGAQKIKKLPPILSEKTERKQHGASDWDTASEEELLCARSSSEEEKQASYASDQSFSPKVLRYRDRVKSAELAWREENDARPEVISEEKLEMVAVLVNHNNDALREYMILIEEENEDIKLYENEYSQIKKILDPMEERARVMTGLIQKKKEEHKKLSKVLHEIDHIQEPLFEKKNEVLCAMITEVHNSYGRIGCPSFPHVMLQNLQDWCCEQREFVESKKLCKEMRQRVRDLKTNKKQEKQKELEALQEERRRRRLEKALSPPVKKTGRKLMPRSRPPKAIKKAEPVKSSSEEEDVL